MQANQRKQYQTNLQVHIKHEISIKFAEQTLSPLAKLGEILCKCSYRNTQLERKETISSKKERHRNKNYYGASKPSLKHS